MTFGEAMQPGMTSMEYLDIHWHEDTYFTAEPAAFIA